jgi:hypothetical protein
MARHNSSFTGYSRFDTFRFEMFFYLKTNKTILFLYSISFDFEA